MTYINEVNGIPIPLGRNSWAIVGGFFAPLQSWVVPRDVAAQVMVTAGVASGLGRECVLTLGDPDNPTTIKRAYLVGSAPADNVQRRTLIFSDVRFYLDFRCFVFDANLRRRIGGVRMVGRDLVDFTPAATVAYDQWTLDQVGFPFDATELRDEALPQLCREDNGIPKIEFSLDPFSFTSPPSTVLPDNSYDGDGLLGLRRVIEAMPGASVYVNEDGELVVYESVGGAEGKLVSQLLDQFSPLWSHGSLEVMDRSGERPSGWDVLYEFESEVRFTFNLSRRGIGSDRVDAQGRPTPYMIPVMQVTDNQLAVPGGDYGFGTVESFVAGQGTWLPQTANFAAWGASSCGNIPLPPLTDDIVAKYAASDVLVDYWTRNTPNVAPNDVYDPIWGARIASLKASWSVHFQVNPAFWSTVRHAFEQRAAIIDPTTGTRGRSPAYCNFGWVPSNPPVGGFDNGMCQNHLRSYPDGEGVLTNGNPSGFWVEIVDMELGIIKINRSDLTAVVGGKAGSVYPRPVTLATLADLANQDSNLDPEFQELAGSSDAAGDAAWKFATILSCSPASPNSPHRFFRVQTTVEDVSKVAGLPAVPRCLGPIQEARGRLAQARTPWTDDVGVSNGSDQVMQLFSGVPGIPADVSDVPPLFEPINEEQELKPLADAIGAAQLVGTLDCYVGSASWPQAFLSGTGTPGGLDGKIRPLGSIQQVIYTVEEDMATTTIHCREQRPQLRAIDYLQGPVRNYVLRQIAREGR